MAMPFIFSCNSKQELATVEQLDLTKYAGQWFEIAKLPNKFEKNLKCVSATYSLEPNGKIKVYNTGYNTKSEEVEEITGKAKVPRENKPGEIKVSFFGPFYGDYYVMDIDSNYQTVLVGSPSRKYLWVLARTITVEKDRMQELMAIAKSKGFDTSKVEMTVQDCK
jgi:lipocalin